MSQKVFKAQNSRLPISRNTEESCAYCATTRSGDESPYKVCGGCRSVRFCCKEHQIKYWPVHKAFCKNVQAQEKLKQSVSPNIVERVTRLRKLVEDFHRAHTHIIEEAMACAIETAPSPIQFFKQHMQISLAYRSDRDDNPSTSFQIKSASLKDNSEAGILSMHLNTMFLPMVEQTHREDHVGQKGYMGTIVICYLVDTMPTFLTAKTIYDSHIPSWPSDRRREWFFSLAYFVERGLIFRECDPYHHRRCKPGVMEKQGSKWVWKEKSLEELKAYDIHLGCKPI